MLPRAQQRRRRTVETDSEVEDVAGTVQSPQAERGEEVERADLSEDTTRVLEGEELDRYLFGPSGTLDYEAEDPRAAKSSKKKRKKHKKNKKETEDNKERKIWKGIKRAKASTQARKSVQASPPTALSSKRPQRVSSSIDGNGMDSGATAHTSRLKSRDCLSDFAVGERKRYRMMTKTHDTGCYDDTSPLRTGHLGLANRGVVAQSRRRSGRPSKQPRLERRVTYDPDLEDGTPCVLPHLPAPVWPPASSSRPSRDELEELAPSDCPACPVRLPMSSNRGHLLTPCGKACTFQEQANRNVLVNAGNIVASVAWCPGEVRPGEIVLTLGVHGRMHPVTCVEQRSEGLGAVQFWCLAADCSRANLCLGLLHDGVCARALQWVPRSKTASRLGLLLMVLDSGVLELHSVPSEPFLLEAESAGQLPPEKVFYRLHPAWIAPISLPGSTPEKDWDRRICSAAARPGTEPGSCLIVGGCDLTVVLLWSVDAHGKTPAGPRNLLHASSTGAPSVHSLAWAPVKGSDIFAAGLANGHVLIWDIQRPMAPINDFFTQVRTPIWNLEWKTPLEILTRQTEGLVYKIDTGKLSRLRSSLDRGGIKHGKHCAGICQVGNKIASAWTDGFCCVEELQERPRKAIAWTATSIWQLKLFLPESEAPLPGTPVDPAGATASPSSGKSSGELHAFKSELKERFLTEQSASMARLRAWEWKSGSFVSMTFGELETQASEVQAASSCSEHATARGCKKDMLHSQRAEEVQVQSAASASSVPSAASASSAEGFCGKYSSLDVPLTGLAARPLYNMAGLQDYWLLACSSAAGLVHVRLVCGE